MVHLGYPGHPEFQIDISSYITPPTTYQPSLSTFHFHYLPPATLHLTPTTHHEPPRTLQGGGVNERLSTTRPTPLLWKFGADLWGGAGVGTKIWVVWG